MTHCRTHGRIDVRTKTSWVDSFHLAYIGLMIAFVAWQLDTIHEEQVAQTRWMMHIWDEVNDEASPSTPPSSAPAGPGALPAPLTPSDHGADELPADGPDRSLATIRPPGEQRGGRGRPSCHSGSLGPVRPPGGRD